MFFKSKWKDENGRWHTATYRNPKAIKGKCQVKLAKRQRMREINERRSKESDSQQTG